MYFTLSHSTSANAVNMNVCDQYFPIFNGTINKLPNTPNYTNLSSCSSIIDVIQFSVSDH